ncbi:hypothetical protein L598_002600000500 [Mesorhizobium sp. J18]|uniref:TAXI family TRAP transporter solute-binding subunit n=1 Tax=Mesorhizobium sp. J18 TaxID=935263 RepID=UPI0011992316|nr:TAXI family TRAP transporter solute-binding subunit [Mesorhizobium sp. J18]TWG96419.1 hypothetical protein L598_002600000500 [Mesorhizobium sp. J18]
MSKNSKKRGLVASAIGLASAAAMLAGLLTAPATAQDRLFLNMGATPTTSGFFTYFVSAGQAIEKSTNGRIVVNVMETGSSVDNLRRIRRGEMEFGLSTVDVAGQAARGVGVFEGEAAWPELRRLHLLAEVPNIYTVRIDSGVEDIQQLEGKRFNAGITGSSTEAQTLDVLDVLGIKPNLYSATTGDAIAAVQDGEIIGYAKSAASVRTPDSSFMQLNTAVNVRILGLTQDQVDKVKSVHPYYSSLTVPAGVYPNQEKDILTMGTAPGLVTTRDAISEQDAYDIVKALIEEKQVQVDAFPSVADVDFVKLTLEQSVVPLHAGAVRYFREKGFEVPDHLVPPEAK